MIVTSRGPKETEQLGLRIGSMLQKGDVVALLGDLGAGKTTFVKGVAAAFGVPSDEVSSPSFTIVSEYPGDVQFYHIDLYRTGGPDDIESAGVWDCIGPDSVAVIEWADRAGGDLPGHVIRIRIEQSGDEERQITIEGLDEENRDNL